MKKCLSGLMFVFTVCVSLPAQSGPGTSISVGDSSQIYVQEIIRSKIPVLIDFWAVWCGPCRMLSPIIADLQKEYHGKITVLKINVDRNRSIATYFKVSSIPVVYIVKDKIVVKRMLGVQPKTEYEAAIQEVLGVKPVGKDSL